MRQQILMLGFWLAVALCLALVVLKLTGEVHWSWWRVLLPLWVILAHNAVYITVGLVWISFAERRSGEEATIRHDRDFYGYQWGCDVVCIAFPG
jgi:energy-coupling factor transporter transmembrane protein EcfT